jgi:uncharacterized Rossmann fold enzyme
MKTLEVTEKYKTQYCIPLWLRDEQILSACKRPYPRITGSDEDPGPVAIVCFGPSLRDTWEQIRDFKTIVTCSGAHKFLIEKGIIPTYHVEVDPRVHKIELLGTPHPSVTYLPASTCHPDYFDHLDKHGAKVVLWHVFSNDEEAYRVLPRGEWALTGGTNVGLRAMTIARFFGHRNHHVFGMDGNQRETKHAAPHPIQDKAGHSLVTYEGIEYKTTPAMLESAKQTFHELDMMKDVTATFYGEGLVQEMAKHYEKKEVPNSGFLGFAAPELISAAYREMNTQLHSTRLDYGVGGGRHAPTVLKLAQSISTTSVLDYGCGKGYLSRAMPFPIWEYDPAIPGKDEAARPADLVVCLDVLEHIEPDKLLFVLDDLRRVTRKVGYFIIHTGPSSKTLADGRNAHLIQQHKQWWLNRLQKFFAIGKIIEQPPLLHVVVGKKG